MKEIPLIRGKFSIVDDEDYDELMQWKWGSLRRGNTCYARRTTRGVLGNKQTIYMHTIVIRTPIGMDTDHINGNGLDNRRCNLRAVSRRGNMQNLHINKTSRFPGVCWAARDGKWRASIYVGGKKESLGDFTNEEEAHQEYLKACAAIGVGAEVQTARIKHPKSSKFKGVSWYKPYHKWVAHINIDGRVVHLGYFSTEDAARESYLKARSTTGVV